MKHCFRIAALLLAVASLAGLIATGAAAATANKVDEAFVSEMPMHHEMAIEMAEMAIEQAEHGRIKSTARKIVRTQSAEISQLEKIAKRLGVTPVSMHDHMAMMEGLDALNEEFRREGLPTLTIGIGINFGVVTVGNIGSSERHNYSAIGDAVNVAARLEGLTKDLGRKILITEDVVSRIEERFKFDPLGSHNVKGHSPVRIWGIRTVRAASAA